MFNSKKLKAIIAGLSLSFMFATSVQAATYTVTSGDSLYTIGKTFGVSSSTIMADNGLSSTNIYPGQVLRVPSKTYTVQSGDSLYLISQKFGITISSIRVANNQWSDYIYPGQVLLIPSTNMLPAASTTSTASKSVIPYSASDLDLLARLINAEAQDQPYKAKAAVAAVVVNRVQSGQFPSSISGVIYQRINGYYQFSPVLNGYINNPATSEDRQAALDALNGYDPTNGALFYFDDSATNSWLWSKTIALRVGNMVFAY